MCVSFVESKSIPQQGLQLIVQLPDGVCRKTKKIDVEMMMKRKLNRVKKEYQIYMHKVHILAWLGHGNYVSKVLNDQELLAASLSLVPGKECYPGERVDMKYLEQITTWYKDKLSLKLDKNENKFKPKAPPLKQILLSQIKSRVVTSRKYLVFIFVAMLRALGLQCRIMFNFVTLPIKPPSSDLCSLSTKSKEEKDSKKQSEPTPKVGKTQNVTATSKKPHCKAKGKVMISQVDGTCDEFDDFDNIMQVDGNSDIITTLPKNNRTRKTKKSNATNDEDDVSPPKRSRKSPNPKPNKTTTSIKGSQNPKPKTNSNMNVSESQANAAQNKTTRKRAKMANQQTNSECAGDTDQSIKGAKFTNDVMENDSKAYKKSVASPRKTRSTKKDSIKDTSNIDQAGTSGVKKRTSNKKPNLETPQIIVTGDVTEVQQGNSSKYFQNENNAKGTIKLSRRRSKTANPDNTLSITEKDITKPIKMRTKSAPGNSVEISKYFDNTTGSPKQTKKNKLSLNEHTNESEDVKRVSHRDLTKSRAKPKNDVTDDLVKIVKGRIKEAKEESKRGIVKGNPIVLKSKSVS